MEIPAKHADNPICQVATRNLQLWECNQIQVVLLFHWNLKGLVSGPSEPKQKPKQSENSTPPSTPFSNPTSISLRIHPSDTAFDYINTQQTQEPNKFKVF